MTKKKLSPKKLSSKEKPSLKKKNHENDICNCKHERIYHQGISGVCYYLKCECYKFRLKEIK